jgi:hypothetical protein
MVRSCASAFGGALGMFVGEITLAMPAVGLFVPAGGGFVEGVPEREEELPVIAPLETGALDFGAFSGGFGARNLIQSTITAIESSDAIKMRISPDSSFFFCGSLTNAPLLASRCCGPYSA